MTAALSFYNFHFQDFFQSQSLCIYKAKPQLRHPWDDQDVESERDASTLTIQKSIQQILAHFRRQDSQVKNARFRTLNHSHPWGGVLRPASPGNLEALTKPSCFHSFLSQL
jgi:hypothetical protein